MRLGKHNKIHKQNCQENRKDDSQEIAIKRYEIYEKTIKPVINFYTESGLLNTVNGEGTISEINSEISAIIEAI